MSQGTSLLPKDKGPATEPGKAIGIKRLQTDTPSGPAYHNVYVRRKVESEHSKVNPSQELKGNERDKAKELEACQAVQHEEANKPQVASPVSEPEEANKPQVASPVSEPEEANKPQVASPVSEPEEANKPQVVSPVSEPEEANKPQVASPVSEPVELVSSKSPEKPNEEIVPEKTEPPVASSTGIQEEVKQSSIEYWNERFNRLQTYLENCDQSTQEGYLRKLRSLSAAGRNMHAIELEKRAIHLLVEEGKELQRMKTLNVLGKVSPNVSSKLQHLQR